jgi:hypothetical protein
MSETTPQGKRLEAIKKYIYMKGYRAGFARAVDELAQQQESVEYLERAAWADLEKIDAEINGQAGEGPDKEEDEESPLVQNCPRN